MRSQHFIPRHFTELRVPDQLRQPHLQRLLRQQLPLIPQPVHPRRFRKEIKVFIFLYHMYFMYRK